MCGIVCFDFILIREFMNAQHQRDTLETPKLLNMWNVMNCSPKYEHYSLAIWNIFTFEKSMEIYFGQDYFDVNS